MENKWNIGQGGEIPIGFGLSLAANEKSMEAFSRMSDEENILINQVRKNNKSNRNPFLKMIATDETEMYNKTCR